MKLHVLTACIRTDNLRDILQSMLKATLHSKNLKVEWHVNIHTTVAPIDKHHIRRLKRVLKNRWVKVHISTFDGSNADSPINPLLDKLQTGYICILDDDNIMHKSFLKEIEKTLDNYKDTPIAMVYPQIMGRPKNKSGAQRIRPARKSHIRPGKIDTGQFTIHRDLIGDLRWSSLLSPTGNIISRPDGIFIYTIFQEYHDSFIVIDKPISYYNYLSSDLDFSLKS